MVVLVPTKALRLLTPTRLGATEGSFAMRYGATKMRYGANAHAPCGVTIPPSLPSCRLPGPLNGSASQTRGAAPRRIRTLGRRLSAALPWPRPG